MTVKTANTYHVPVLLTESVDGLQVRQGGVYADMTFGGGGHSKEILRRLNGSGHLYSFDQDADAEQNIKLDSDSPFQTGNFTFVRSNFRYLRNWMRYYQEDGIDGLLADLGVSSHHFDDEQRGFSFRYNAPLDMRMNKRAGMTAAQLLNTYTEEQLAQVFYLYGELRQSRQLARAIANFRGNHPMESTQDLLNATENYIHKQQEKKELAQLFQALRIEVNHEMDALTEMLQAAIHCLKPGGRLSVITYHSLEDRLVKNFIRSGNATGTIEQDFFGKRNTPLKAVQSKPITPSAEEQQTNPRSRSAKLRIAEKL